MLKLIFSPTLPGASRFFIPRPPLLPALRQSCLVCGVLLVPLFLSRGSWNGAFWAEMLLLSANVLYGLEDLSGRALFLVFNGTFFLFLMARPFVLSLRRAAWWADCSAPAVRFALTLLFLGLLGLLAGAALFSRLKRHGALRQGPRRNGRPSRLPPKREADFFRLLRVCALCLFAVTLLCYSYQELLTLTYLRGRPYTDYYLPGRPLPPFPIGTLSAMMPAALCVFLSAKPRKEQALVPLALYLLSGVPRLMIGARGPIVLRALFLLVYCFLRDASHDPQQWLDRRSRCLAAAAAVPAVVALSAWNYLRDGRGTGGLSLLALLPDFLVKQGVSFRVLCLSWDALGRLPPGLHWYTIGGFLDYVLYGGLGRRLFGTPDLGLGNSVLQAAQSHSFAHALGYAAHPDYLSGSGYGSSFLLESYADFGRIGVLAVSAALGALLLYLPELFRGSWLGRTVALVCLTTVFFVPRAEATGFLTFLITPHFWTAVAFCRLGVLLGERCSLPRAKRKGRRI